jgi:hypothetical protein
MRFSLAGGHEDTTYSDGKVGGPLNRGPSSKGPLDAPGPLSMDDVRLSPLLIGGFLNRGFAICACYSLPAQPQSPHARDSRTPAGASASSMLVSMGMFASGV